MKKNTIHHEIIEMAWADEISFDAIEFQTGLPEKEVIAIMRANLKRSSYQLWRKRVYARKSKHSKKNKME
tara:strand:- start:532 stop:741 length:210 start_codon:yes stop_codon:yes gene_type:complete